MRASGAGGGHPDRVTPTFRRLQARGETPPASPGDGPRFVCLTARVARPARGPRAGLFEVSSAMEPLLSWLVAGLSAFLLVTGGFVLARALAAPRERRHVEREQQHSERERQHSERERQHVERERQRAERERQHVEREHLLRGELAEARADHERWRHARAAQPEKEHAGNLDVPVRSRDDFGEATALPAPVSYFDSPQDRSSAPGLRQISEEEYELQAEVPPSPLEADAEADAEAFGNEPRGETRQFNLHSPEAVVHFMKRIDELSDENRELRNSLADQERQLQEYRVEGGEQVQRFATLEGTAAVLREELKRRNARIKQIEELLENERRTGASTRADPLSRSGPPPIPRSPSSDGQAVLDAPEAPSTPEDPPPGLKRINRESNGEPR